MDSVRLLSRYVHCIQKERGSTSANVCIHGSDALFCSAQAKCRELTDYSYKALLTVVELDFARDIKQSFMALEEVRELADDGLKVEGESFHLPLLFHSVFVNYNKVVTSLLRLNKKIPPHKWKATPVTADLFSFYNSFCLFKEATGIERALLSGILALKEDRLLNMLQPGTLFADLILVCQQQKMHESEWKAIAKRCDHSCLHAIFIEGVKPNEALRQVQDLLEFNFDLKRVRAAVTLHSFWTLLTVFIDKLHSLELLLVEEIDAQLGLSGLSSGNNSGNNGAANSPLRGNGVPTPVQSTINLYDIAFANKVGAGAAGTTYLGTWNSARVAVKVASTDEFGLSNFSSEIEILKRLNHPNVVRYFGCVVKPPTHCLVLEYADGGDLEEVLRHKTGPEFFWTVSSGVCAGMAYLHSMDVIHRDLKPSNILLTSSGDVKVTDFGVSCVIKKKSVTSGAGELEVLSEEELTAECGTYRWMAPEVMRHEAYSEKADIYSYGVCLWQLLTRQDPFAPLSQLAAAREVAVNLSRPAFPQGMPNDVEKFIAKLWHEDASERPSFEVVKNGLLLNIREAVDKKRAWRKFMEKDKGHKVYCG